MNMISRISVKRLNKRKTETYRIKKTIQCETEKTMLTTLKCHNNNKYITGYKQADI